MTAWYRVVNDIRQCGGYVQGGSSFENPHIDKELLKYQIKNKPKSYVDQVVNGKFIDNSSMMFASRVSSLFDSSLDFSDVKKGCKYIEGWDLARGRNRNSDFTVGFRIDVTHKPYRIVKYWAFQLPWTEKERENINLKAGYQIEQSSVEREIRKAQSESNSIVYVDSTGVGDTLFGILSDIAKPVDFRGSKEKLLEHCQAVIDSGILKSPFIQELADEMTMYCLPDTNLKTDFLMALVVSCSSIPVVKPRVVRIEKADIFRR